MSRSIGGVRSVQEVIPDWLAPIIALFTQLGDIWFLVLLLAVLYWKRSATQEKVMVVGGMLTAGIGIYRSLKYIFGLPRPDEPLLEPELVPWIIRPLYELTAFSSSYGFPSGHATISTIVYFGLAEILDVGSRRLRYLCAAVLVAFIGLTRIILGLHFLVDIIVGIGLGATILFVGFRGVGRISRDHITVLLFVAIVLNTLYLFTSDADIEAAIMFGAALGLFGGWQLILLARELVAVSRPSRAAKPLLVRGGLALVTLGPLIVALEEFPLLSGETPPAVGAAGIVIAVLVIIPVARYSKRLRTVFASLSFWTHALTDWLRRRIRNLR